MSSSAELMPIGDLARRAGRSASSIRYYEQIGLLPAPARQYGQRRYDADAVRRLTVIAAAQRAGLTLDEIRTLFDAARADNSADPGGRPPGPPGMAGNPGISAAVEQLRQVAERKLPELTAMIERSMVVRDWLRAAARCECPSLYDCALFDDGAHTTNSTS
jgi:MerR family transcriptional regulator, redox-sensitive transcriptional activator SoxR